MKAEITKDNIDRAKKLLDALQSTVKMVGELSEENFYLKAKITKATEKDTEGFDKEFEKFCYDSLSVLTNDPTKQLLYNCARHFADWQKAKLLEDGKDI